MKKFIVFGIFVLFLTVSANSSDVNINQKIEIESIKNSEIKPLDNNKEIITFIGGVTDSLNVTFKGRLYFEMWEDDGIYFKGYKYTLFPLGISKFSGYCKHVIAPYFIVLHYVVHYGSCTVLGFAFGNIEWE